MRLRSLLIVPLMAVSLTACSGNGFFSDSSSCSGTVTYSNGPVHPDYQWSWTLTIHEDATADFSAGLPYAESEKTVFEKKNIKLDEKQLSSLCGFAYSFREDSIPPIGGSSVSWALTYGDSSLEGEDFGGDMKDEVEALIGSKLLSQAEAAIEEKLDTLSK